MNEITDSKSQEYIALFKRILEMKELQSEKGVKEALFKLTEVYLKVFIGYIYSFFIIKNTKKYRVSFCTSQY